MGKVSTCGDDIVSVERDENLGPIEIVRNDLDDPINEAAAIKTRQFIEKIGNESLEQARQRAFADALATHGYS